MINALNGLSGRFFRVLAPTQDTEESGVSSPDAIC